MFNLLTSFAATFILVRSITFALRSKPSFGPLRDVRVGRRHIHHFVPGIVIAFAAGAGAILTSDEKIEPWLAVPFGVGMGLTLDESALLLELEDVYWSSRGIAQRADHAGGDSDARGAGARPALPLARRAGRARAGHAVNLYAVKYSLGRAWMYSMLSFGLWTAYWFYVTRRLFDGETGRGRDDAILHTLGLYVPVLNVFILYWLYRDLSELRRRLGLSELPVPGYVVGGVFVPPVLYSIALGKVNEFWDARTQGLATEAPTPGVEKAVIAVGATFWLLIVLFGILLALLLAFSSSTSS